MKRLIFVVGILLIIVVGFLYWKEKNQLLELTLTDFTS